MKLAALIKYLENILEEVGDKHVMVYIGDDDKPIPTTLNPIESIDFDKDDDVVSLNINDGTPLEERLSYKLK